MSPEFIAERARAIMAAPAELNLWHGLQALKTDDWPALARAWAKIANHASEKARSLSRLPLT